MQYILPLVQKSRGIHPTPPKGLSNHSQFLEKGQNASNSYQFYASRPIRLAGSKLSWQQPNPSQWYPHGALFSLLPFGVYGNTRTMWCSKIHSSIQQANEFFCVGKGQNFKRHMAILVCWHKPHEGWYKLNFNGASLGNSRKAGGGGLIRDSHGRWVKGYMRYIGIATSIIAEFQVLRDGLILDTQLGITHLAVELDAKVIVDLALSNKSPNNSYFPLLNDCRYLLGQFQQVKVSHAF